MPGSFTRSGIWSLRETRNSIAGATYNFSVPVELMVVGGGGSGGGNGGIGGGGGAGGVLYASSVDLFANHCYVITVGGGGSGGGNSNNGSNSSICFHNTSNYIAIGGGRGASYFDQTGNFDGGSGGGGARDLRGCASGTLGTFRGSALQTSQGPFTGYGNPGGYSSTNGSSISTGGGGGAGAAGCNASAAGAGNGGAGRTLMGLTLAGGGGSDSFNGGTYGTGGSGGGGNVATNATPYTGSGGGGGNYVASNAGNGAGGIVVISYLEKYPLAATTGSPTYSTLNGFRRYEFCGSGSLAFNI